MTYYLLAFFIISSYARPDSTVPTNLGAFTSKEACIDASHKVNEMLKSRGGTSICVQVK